MIQKESEEQFRGKEQDALKGRIKWFEKRNKRLWKEVKKIVWREWRQFNIEVLLRVSSGDRLNCYLELLFEMLSKTLDKLLDELSFEFASGLLSGITSKKEGLEWK